MSTILISPCTMTQVCFWQLGTLKLWRVIHITGSQSFVVFGGLQDFTWQQFQKL